MTETPLDEYALLADSHGAALVSRHGAVDWLCFRRFDAPSTLGRLLDEGAGHWTIAPQAPEDVKVTRRYLAPSLVLESRLEGPTGTVVLTEALALGPNERGHDLGRGAPHALLRRIRGEKGTMRLVVSFAPRPEYGLVHPLLEPWREGLLARGGPDVLLLCGPAEWHIEESTATAVLEVQAGEEVSFALQHAPAWTETPDHWGQDDIRRRLDETQAAWQSWADGHHMYEGPWRDLVATAASVMQGLTFFPTHAMVAAPTMGLPERVGGKRNWDYRYSWIRDTSFTLNALWLATCPDEAERAFDFLAQTAMSRVRRDGHLQIMYGIGGEQDLFERPLEHLGGWRGSRPVLLGNDAARQSQVDVYGELLDAAYRFRGHLKDMDDDTLHFFVWCVDAAARVWRDKDQGIWEMRSAPRHFVHSKLMCWVALDRGIKIADILGANGHVRDWEAARAAVREEILDKGYDAEQETFVQSFGDTALDASNLVIPMVGFLPPDDPRVVGTVRAVAQHLVDERGLVFRYKSDDGLEPEHGSFLLCTFWLAEAQALIGATDAARATFERAISYANDLGLFSEEVDSDSGALLGNFPQALSHIGLVNAAWAIAKAEGWRRDGNGLVARPEGVMPAAHASERH